MIPRRAFLFELSAAAAWARERPSALARAIDRTLAGTSVLDSALVGMHIVSLSNGRTLFARNAATMVAPASNTKLFTTATALSLLGPQYRMRTAIVAEGGVESGRVRGDVAFVGGGDPSLSRRAYPYRKPPPNAEPEPFETIPAIEELADAVASRGITSIEGDVIGDDRRYVWNPYPEGWSVDDPLWDYGAAVSAIIVNDNSFAVRFGPGANVGESAVMDVWPAPAPFTIANEVVTVPPGETRTTERRLPGARQLRITGKIAAGAKPEVDLLGAGDPALWAAALFRDALERRSIRVRGGIAARHRWPENTGEPDLAPVGIELASRMSPPLVQILQVIDKVSQNLHAEAALRELGAAIAHDGTADAGLKVEAGFLRQAGIADDEYRIFDGSGLSRNTLIAPQAITKLLLYMYRSPHRDEWVSLLPVGGDDGTLQHRFHNIVAARAIHAKTGSLSHVRALSGYAFSHTHGPVAFSLVVNNSIAPGTAILGFLDTIGLELLER